ncbi:hypothetical protein HNP55_002602 [Paucibacter oligotrophus]|uniref:Glycosyltransferase 2-like domain-containing protein n=1 Tax=Roseateles oligotrophus TaxID=1769250 RepID=A0A840L7M7_9BURK|nr:glycosyltransferase family A protein [Roseateles oligotrophus]MBB4844066.1 hypothetical protein [Roseateles oligotrophus]
MKITTLIPAYKTKYIVELLVSLQRQTRPSNRIVFSDDSPDGAYTALLDSEALRAVRQQLPIEVYAGPRKGAYENFKHLARLWGGGSELVHLLLDDDVMFPDFYERHLQAHASGRFSCSISGRWTANEQGQPIGVQPLPAGVAASRERMLSLSDEVLFMSTVPLCTNWLGEFSNCVMRAETLPLLFEPRFADVSYAGLWDLGYFLAASTQAPVAYIQDRLGYFRTGGDNNSSQLFGKFMKAAHLGYVALAVGGERIGKLNKEQARQCYAGIAPALLQRYASQADMQPFCVILARMAEGDAQAVQAFEQAWAHYLREQGF